MADVAATDLHKPEKRSWIAPFSIVYVLAVFFATQVVAGIALYTYAASKGIPTKAMDDWLTHSVLAQFCYVLIAEVLLVAAVFAGLRLLGWSRVTIGLTRPTLRQVGIGVLATVPYYVLYGVLIAIIVHIVPALNVDQKQEIGFETVIGPIALLLTFISLVVLPPLAEEITMRGFLYSGLRSWLPKIWAGLFVSLIFGAAHLSGGGAAGPLWIGAIDTFVLSLVLVFLREKTGNLWAGITLHACKNGVAFLLLYVFKVV
jgi:membrane protease YdiL (CAAX protease family)